MFYRGIDIPHPWIVEAGTHLTDLSFSLRDQHDNHMELRPEMFINSSYISESNNWNPQRKKKKGAKACSERLSDIQVPDHVPEGGIEEYEFELNTECLQYSYSFKLTVKPCSVRLHITKIDDAA